MKDLILNLGEVSTEKIVDYIQDIAEDISVKDIVEIISKPPISEMKRINEKFHPEKQQKGFSEENVQFLLNGEARAEYGKICKVFDDFITGPGMEGREIKELTESYEQFYNAMQIVGLDIQNKKRLESALAGVAIESEMQGFIYGFKLFDALLNRMLTVTV